MLAKGRVCVDAYIHMHISGVHVDAYMCISACAGACGA